MRTVGASEAVATQVGTALPDAYAVPGDRDQVLAAGFDGYRTEPIDRRTLARSIDAFLPPELRLPGAAPSSISERQ